MMKIVTIITALMLSACSVMDKRSQDNQDSTDIEKSSNSFLTYRIIDSKGQIHREIKAVKKFDSQEYYLETDEKHIAVKISYKIENCIPPKEVTIQTICRSKEDKIVFSEFEIRQSGKNNLSNNRTLIQDFSILIPGKKLAKSFTTQFAQDNIYFEFENQVTTK